MANEYGHQHAVEETPGNLNEDTLLESPPQGREEASLGVMVQSKAVQVERTNQAGSIQENILGIVRGVKAKLNEIDGANIGWKVEEAHLKFQLSWSIPIVLPCSPRTVFVHGNEEEATRAVADKDGSADEIEVRKVVRELLEVISDNTVEEKFHWKGTALVNKIVQKRELSKFQSETAEENTKKAVAIFTELVDPKHEADLKDKVVTKLKKKWVGLSSVMNKAEEEKYDVIISALSEVAVEEYAVGF